MNEYTPPTGGHLPHTASPNPGDRIAGALASLRRNPAPGWLWALWAAANEPGSPLVPDPPPDAAIVRIGEGVGFDTAPPHYGMVPRHELPPYGEDDAKGPEVLAGRLVGMLATGTDSSECMCAKCISTGMPPGLMQYLSCEVVPDALDAPGHDTAADPFAGRRFTIALEVAAARAMREAYIHTLREGPAPKGWHRQALDPTYPGHYLARMSDTGLAAGVCALWWWEPLIAGGLVPMYPVEMFAALAEGFSYPIPEAGTAAWREQAEREESRGARFGGLLHHTAADLAGVIADGICPWDVPNLEGRAA